MVKNPWFCYLTLLMQPACVDQQCGLRTCERAERLRLLFPACICLHTSGGRWVTPAAHKSERPSTCAGAERGSALLWRPPPHVTWALQRPLLKLEHVFEACFWGSSDAEWKQGQDATEEAQSTGEFPPRHTDDVTHLWLIPVVTAAMWPLCVD